MAAASLGGPAGLPADFPVPVLIVQRRGPAPGNRFTEMLRLRAALPVQTAQDGQPVTSAGRLTHGPAGRAGRACPRVTCRHGMLRWSCSAVQARGRESMPVSDAVLQDMFTGIDLTGVLANAMLGGVIARGARLDPVGFATLAILSGLGGGLIRDTLLQHGTPVALTGPAYIPTALAGAMAAFFLRVDGRLWTHAFPFVDALALGCWAATGAQRTLADGLAWLPAVLLGTITAVGGGMTRDIFLRRIPQIFGGNTLYATSAVLASGVMVVLYRLGHASLGLILATLTGAGLTLLARWRGWGLPEADVSQPPRVWPRTGRPHRSRDEENDQETTSAKE